MSRNVTSTCITCKAEFSYERSGRGAYRKYCGDECSRTEAARRAKAKLDQSNPMCDFEAECVVCGEGFVYRARSMSSRVRKYCGEQCSREAQHKASPSRTWKTMTPEQRAARSAADKRYRQKREAAKVEAMKADGTYKYCAGCGGDMVQHPSWSFCKLPACRELAAERSRLLHNAGVRRAQAAYKERTGESSSSRYRDRPYNKNYNYRDRHPDRAKHYDHVRRARMANCERESFPDSEIFERDGFVCGICNEPVDMELRFPDVMSASLDHIIPLSRGGGHVRSNVRLAHLGCNARKCARLDDEFITAS